MRRVLTIWPSPNTFPVQLRGGQTHEVAQLSHCPHFHLNPRRVSGSSAQSSSIEQLYPSRNASISVWGEATVLIAQHFGSIPLSFAIWGELKEVRWWPRSPQPPSGRVREALPLKQISYNHLGYHLTVGGSTSVLVNETVLGNISGHWTQSSVPGWGMAQLTLPWAISVHHWGVNLGQGLSS